MSGNRSGRCGSESIEKSDPLSNRATVIRQSNAGRSVEAFFSNRETFTNSGNTSSWVISVLKNRRSLAPGMALPKRELI